MVAVRLAVILQILFLLNGGSSRLAAQSPGGSDAADSQNARTSELVASELQLSGPTLGGRQFWSDHLVSGQWRIQQNVITGHYRLLDPRDFRRASGTFEECLGAYRQIEPNVDVCPAATKVVILLHGLGRTRQSMEDLAEYLQDELPDHRVVNLSYASTRTSIDDHAHALARVIQNLGRFEQISFVAHSMGNLVIRRYLSLLQNDPNGQATLQCVNRIVMLAPPNRGAALADRFRTNPVFRALWGESGGEIAQWEQLEPQLATPPVEFGILAGGLGDDRGRNPWIDGDDDFVVAVDETRLPGATDFAVLPTLHGVIMNDPVVRDYTVRFLQHGYFVSARERAPITADALTAP